MQHTTMTTDWDPSREYDSQTFSEDYNLHGASARSLDHPSVTRDHISIFDILDGRHDDYSIDNADMGLIAEIVEGKAPHQRAPLRRKTNQPDENSEDSMMRYLINGSQELLEYHGSPEDIYIRHNGPQADKQRLFTDDGNDDYIQEAIGTPRRQTRISDQRLTPKISPVMRRSLLPVRQPLENSPKPGRRMRSLSIDKGFKSPALRFGTPSRHGPGPGSGIPKPSPRRNSGTNSGIPKASSIPRKVPTDGIQSKKNVAIEPPIKPIFRSALKSASANGINGNGQQQKTKLVRHIQLPTEILDSNDDSEDPTEQSRGNSEKDQHELKGNEEQVNHVNQLEEPEEPEEPEIPEGLVVQDEDANQGYVGENDQGQEQNRNQGHDGDLAEGLNGSLGDRLSSQAVSSLPRLPRFTRITKKVASPGKKLLATIPTPLDDSNEQVQKTIKELKEMLGRLGLLPISSTLGISLDELDSTTMDKGGLCETVNLLLKLGGMYEKQKEVIYQMTDQIMDNETRAEKSSEMDEKLEEITQELKTAKLEQDMLKTTNQELVERSAALTEELQKLRNTEVLRDQSTEKNREKLLRDAESQVSGNWENVVQELIDGKRDGSTALQSGSLPQQSDVGPSFWKAHIQKIEKEVQELKAKLDKYQSSSSGHDISYTEDLESKMDGILLENRRLIQKNKSLTKELLKAHEADSANEKRIRDSKYKSILKNVMEKLGVDHEQSILPALKEIERVVRDIPSLRRFVTKVERIIWESEILEGTVRVQKYTRSNPNSTETNTDGQDHGNGRDGGGLNIKVGRTCSQSYDSTLQRLKEWSELLDVLNHVEFADNTEDEAEV